MVQYAKAKAVLQHQTFLEFHFIFILLCNKQSRQTREINNGEVQEQKNYKEYNNQNCER